MGKQGQLPFHIAERMVGASEANAILQVCLEEGLVRLEEQDDPLDENDKLIVLTSAVPALSVR
jgi:hypothetical protein